MNASILPLLFLSGIFIPLGDDAPAVDHGGRRRSSPSSTSPTRCARGFLPDVTVTTPEGQVRAFPFEWTDVLVVAAWGVAGLVLAARFFSWEPRR